jgi:predicted DNA-binding transcriptional regulator YafY
MKVDRLLSIVMLLLERKTMSAKALAEMFEVSLRTIYRDMESINQAGIPVVSAPGLHGGFQIMQEYKLDKKLFTPADMTAILMGLGSLASMLGSEDWVRTQAKIKSLLPLHQAEEIELKSNQVAVDLKPWMGNRTVTEALPLLKQALEGETLFSFLYSDRRGMLTKRTIEPYRLVLKDNHWYIFGYCLERSDFRLFKLARMTDGEVLKEHFVHRELPSELSDFSDRMAAKQQNIILRIHESILDRVQDHCGRQNLEPCGNGWFIAHFPFIADDMGYHLLLSFGDQCECIAPQEVREELIARIQGLMKVYGELNIQDGGSIR